MLFSKTQLTIIRYKGESTLWSFWPLLTQCSNGFMIAYQLSDQQVAITYQDRSNFQSKGLEEEEEYTIVHVEEKNAYFSENSPLQVVQEKYSTHLVDLKNTGRQCTLVKRNVFVYKEEPQYTIKVRMAVQFGRQNILLTHGARGRHSKVHQPLHKTALELDSIEQEDLRGVSDRSSLKISVLEVFTAHVL